MGTVKDNYIIRSKRQMRALAASTRQEIVDVLSRMGTVSVAELATAAYATKFIGRTNNNTRRG